MLYRDKAMRLNPADLMRESRHILRLAWPVVLTSLNWTLLHLIDVAVVGHAGTDQLGALAAGRAMTFITIVIGIAALSGVIVFASRADGAGDAPRCGDIFRQGLIAATGMGLVCGVAMFVFATELTRAIGVGPELVSEGSRVVQAMALAFPAQMIATAAAYFMEGISRPTRPMVVNLAMLPVNAVLAWAWVGGHFGLPAEGAVGAVRATAAVSLVGALAMLLAVWTLPEAPAMTVRALSRDAWRRALLGTPALLRFGAVPGLASGLEMAGFSWLIVLSTRLGPVSAAAFQAVFSLHNFAFALALGVASAAGVRAGNAVGEGRPGEALPRSLIAVGLVVVSMSMMALAYAFAASPLVALFTEDNAVRSLAAPMLALLAPFMLFDGMQMVFVYALRSLGDQVMAGINGIIAFFLTTGGVGWWLVERGVGPFALVYAAAAGMVVAALLQTARMLVISRRMARRS